MAICYIAYVWYSTPAIYHKKVWYGNMLYAMLYAKLWKLQEKLSKWGCIYRPRRRWRAGGRQHNTSAADSLRWLDSGALCSSSLNQPLLLASGGPARAAGRAGGTVEWPPAFCSKHSVVAGRATAIPLDSRSLHSLHAVAACTVALGTVGEKTWFETAFANNQSQAPLLSSWLMNDRAKTYNIVVDSSTNSIKNTSCNSLDNILQLSVVEKKFTTQLEVDTSLHSVAINQNL